jgi:membrane-bound lytic murein transglycosylase F
MEIVLRLLLYISLAALLGTCSSQPPLLDQILEVGELRVVTRDSPTAYVLSPDGPSGPEYDLTQAFADELGVKLVIEPVVSVSEILPYLMAGKAHMAAAGLSVTNSRREYVNFGHPYEMVDMHLIYKLGTGKPRTLDDVIGRSIEVVAGTSHADTLMSLQQLYPDLQWTENADVEVADLMAKVADGEVDFTISDSTEFNIQRHFYPDLRVALDLVIGEPLAWAFPIGKGDSLLGVADDFLIGIDRTGVLAQVKDRYYGHTNQFDYVGTRNFIRHFESRLPRYRITFEEAGARFGVDWRLLAAIGYQESHWRSQAVSPTGVRGIMMLTEDTARYLGLEIFGGAQYYARQTERVADSVGEPDRTWMALAAYNVGFNHIKDARQIAEWQSGNPDTWVDVSKALPLLAQRKWYTRVPFGYARGWEPVLYVNNIRSYYNILKWLTRDDEPVILELAPEIESELADEIAVEETST